MNHMIIMDDRTNNMVKIPNMIPLAYDAIMRLGDKIKEANEKEAIVKTMQKNRECPVWHKYILTIEEAAVYFGIGEKRLRRIVSENMEEDFVVEIGSQVRIKRILFEKFIDLVTTI